MSCQISNSMQFPPCHSFSKTLSDFKDPVYAAAHSVFPLSAIVPAACGSLFGIVSPIGGAIYGVSSLLTFLAVPHIPNFSDSPNDHVAVRVAKIATSFFAAIAVGSLASTALGYPLSLIAAAKISAISFLPIAIISAAAVIFAQAHKMFEHQEGMRRHREEQMKMHSL